MTKSYIVLALSILFEIFGTAMLKMSNGFTDLLPSIGVTVSYGISFYFFSLCLKKLPLSLANEGKEIFSLLSLYDFYTPNPSLESHLIPL